MFEEEEKPVDSVTENGFYIPNASLDPTWVMPLMGHKVRCTKCKRKILVQVALLGTVHHTDPSVICAECIDPQDETWKQWKAVHPLVAEDLEKWAR